MIDQGLTVVLFVFQIALIFTLFKEAKSIQIFIKKLMFANRINKFTAFIDNIEFDCFHFNSIQIFFRNIQRRDECVGVKFSKSASEKDEI